MSAWPPTGGRVFAVACVVAAGLLPSCSDEEQPADSRARVLFNVDATVAAGAVSVTLDDGASTWFFRAANFQPDASTPGRFLSPEVQTKANGALRVSFRIDDGSDNTVSSGSLKAALSPNWRWTFEIVHSRRDSTLTCTDCIQTSIFDMADPALSAEVVYVLWKGRGP